MTRRSRKPGDNVSCRNLLLMYNYQLKCARKSKQTANSLFDELIPEGMTRQSLLDERTWINYETYDETVWELVAEKLGNIGLLFTMGSLSSKCEPPGGMIKTLWRLLLFIGISVRGAYEHLVPAVFSMWNHVKECLVLEVDDECILYKIRFFDMFSPLKDWTSDWWIRGNLAGVSTGFKMKAAVVTSRILPFDLVRMFRERFADLQLRAEWQGDKFMVNGEVCGRRVFLAEDARSVRGVPYFSGKYFSERPAEKVFEGVLITRVLPIMKNEEQGWQVVDEGAIYISEDEFASKRVNPYFVLEVVWGRVPRFLRVVFAVLKILSIFRVFSKTSLREQIAQWSERAANAELLAQERTTQLLVVSEQRAEALQIIQQQHGQLQEHEQRIREMFIQQHPSRRIAELVIEHGMLQPQRRMASVLYADICGSTAATAALGPEVWMGYVSLFYNIGERIVMDNGGGAYQRIGDEILGIFIPELTTDKEINHADAALLTAISLLHALASQKEKFPFQIRIGIATGTILIGSVGTEKSSIQCFGEPMNEGARFNSKSEPGRIVFGQKTLNALSEDTRILYCRPEEMTVRENVQLKGVSTGRTLYSL